MPAFGGKADL